MERSEHDENWRSVDDVGDNNNSTGDSNSNSNSTRSSSLSSPRPDSQSQTSEDDYLDFSMAKWYDQRWYGLISLIHGVRDTLVENVRASEPWNLPKFILVTVETDMFADLYDVPNFVQSNTKPNYSCLTWNDDRTDYKTIAITFVLERYSRTAHRIFSQIHTVINRTFKVLFPANGFSIGCSVHESVEVGLQESVSWKRSFFYAIFGTDAESIEERRLWQPVINFQIRYATRACCDLQRNHWDPIDRCFQHWTVDEFRQPYGPDDARLVTRTASDGELSDSSGDEEDEDEEEDEEYNDETRRQKARNLKYRNEQNAEKILMCNDRMPLTMVSCTKKFPLQSFVRTLHERRVSVCPWLRDINEYRETMCHIVDQYVLNEKLQLVMRPPYFVHLYRHDRLRGALEFTFRKQKNTARPLNDLMSGHMIVKKFLVSPMLKLDAKSKSAKSLFSCPAFLEHRLPHARKHPQQTTSYLHLLQVYSSARRGLPIHPKRHQRGPHSFFSVDQKTLNEIACRGYSLDPASATFRGPHLETMTDLFMKYL
jgi:hypothetical protein